jgi:hypothetical protein
MTESIINQNKSKSIDTLLIFGLFILAIISVVVIYLVFLKSDNWLSQKTKTIEIGTDVQICDLVNCTDEIGISYHPKPADPYALGKLEITFAVSKGEESRDITFTYIVLDTTVPVIEKINSQILVGEEFDLSKYIKVTDNSGEALLNKVIYTSISTTTLGDFSTELSVKDSSGNETKYKFEYSIVDPTAIAPDLPGTKKVMQYINGLNRVTYIALEDNPYGVTAGLYVGEFKKEVTFEGEEVGGVVLIPKVVEKLLADRDGKAIFIPADISEINNKKSVDLIFLDVTLLEKGLWKEYMNYLLQIHTNGNSVSVCNPYIGIEWTNAGTIIAGRGIPNDYTNYVTSLDFTDPYKFATLGQFSFDELFQGITPFGQKITQTEKRFGIVRNIMTPNLTSIDKNEVLKIGNSIVFLKDLD